VNRQFCPRLCRRRPWAGRRRPSLCSSRPADLSLIPTCGPRLSQGQLDPLVRSGAPLWAAGASGLTPAPVARVHDPSGVATHGVALWSAGHSRFKSAMVVTALLVPCLRPIPRLSLRLSNTPLAAGFAPAVGRAADLTHLQSYGERRFQGRFVVDGEHAENAGRESDLPPANTG
jgi:hypothetical protein